MEFCLMSQNLVSITFNPSELSSIDGALAQLEGFLVNLVSLQPSQRVTLFKMGEKSEMFARQTLHALTNNPQIVPASLGLNEALRDLAALDALRPRLQRLKRMVERGDDTETALGSDIMHTALEGYGQLKLSGKNQGLDGLRADLSIRFSKPRRAKDEPAT
jgi:hypothetical protein